MCTADFDRDDDDAIAILPIKSNDFSTCRGLPNAGRDYNNANMSKKNVKKRDHRRANSYLDATVLNCTR